MARPYRAEPNRIRLRTTQVRGHVHVAEFDDAGNGETDPAADGHTHRIRGLNLVPSAGHSHALTDIREGERHEVVRRRARVVAA